jgi:hypothetical protein
MFRRVALVEDKVLKEFIAFIIKAKRMSTLGTFLVIYSSETSALRRATRHHILEEVFF